jgi:3-phenylpropionate/trans-cinnamate dioxygenase ferredoxin reductase component
MRTLSSTDHVVVVGAGLAGWRFIEALRREGFDGQLTLIGDEVHAPYDRPPLSKQVMVGKWGPEKATLATQELIAKNDVSMRLGVGAQHFDVANTTVQLADGALVQGTHVVIATGTKARHLDVTADGRLHYVRRIADVERLDEELATIAPGSAIGIIGGGFIGAETATALKTRGFRPVVLEAASRPLVGVLGERVSSWLMGLASAADVELRVDQHIEDVIESAEGLRILFGDESDLVVTTIIAGIGVTPNVEWLSSSGLQIDNGVLTDENHLVTDHVAAIGDVARFSWRNVGGVDLVRIEHWEVANLHASALARHWMTDEPPKLLIPYFWSDQYGQKIQLLGHPSPDDEVDVVEGRVEEAKWLALFHRGDIVSGIVTLNNPRGLMLSRLLLEEPTTLAHAIATAPWST